MGVREVGVNWAEPKGTSQDPGLGEGMGLMGQRRIQGIKPKASLRSAAGRGRKEAHEKKQNSGTHTATAGTACWDRVAGQRGAASLHLNRPPAWGCAALGGARRGWGGKGEGR